MKNVDMSDFRLKSTFFEKNFFRAAQLKIFQKNVAFTRRGKQCKLCNVPQIAPFWALSAVVPVNYTLKKNPEKSLI